MSDVPQKLAIELTTIIRNEAKLTVIRTVALSGSRETLAGRSACDDIDICRANNFR